MKLSKRHIAKTITWRAIGTIDTVVLSWFISGDYSLAFQVGGFELITKMILYYFHERWWFKSKIGNTNKRHVLKTFSWRAIGTIDTVVLAALITGNPLTGLKIGVAEIFTKMLLYFVHEKLWYRIHFGLDRRNKLKKRERIGKMQEVHK